MKSSLRILFTSVVIATTFVIPNFGYANANFETLQMASTPLNLSDIGQPDTEITDYVIERSTSAKILDEKGREIGVI